MIRGVQVIRVHGREILDLKLDEGAGEFGAVTQAVGEGV
jgi:hypothetical protein